MRQKLNGKLAMVGSIVLCIVLTQIELPAFSGTSFAVASVDPASQAPAANPAVPSTVQAAVPQQPAHKSSKKKWIVILAVGAGAAVAILLARTQGKSPASPTITVGAPTVGQ
jgi:hypothetical protein